MATPNEALARSITRSANGHAYATIQLLVDRRRVGDAFRAYGYFRWVDDRLDLGDLDGPQARAFLARQRALIGAAYRGETMAAADPEEELLQELVGHDPRRESGLALYIGHMMDVMAFDAVRRGRLISAEELTGYTRSLAAAVMEALHYFIGGEPKGSRSPARYLAASGAHIAHMLRDTYEDVARGYFNIPLEVLQQGGISAEQIESPPYRAWVRGRVERASRCFRLGRAYLAQVHSLRCRIACLAYCIRFERCLRSIQRDAYHLRPGQVSDRHAAGSEAAFLAGVAAAVWRPSRAVSSVGWSSSASIAGDPRPGPTVMTTQGPPGPTQQDPWPDPDEAWQAADGQPHDPPLRRRSEKSSPPIVVIGSGIGGIAAAAHLARLGFHVRVFEKNGRPGGRLDHFWRDGHHFDTGPTLLVLPLVYQAEFERLGTSFAQALDLQRVDPTYRLIFEDGRQLALTSDDRAMRDQLEAIEPGSYAAYLRYLKEGADSYRTAMELLVDREPRLLPDLLSPHALALLRQIPSFLPHYRRMRTYFDDPRLKAAFTFQDIYMGLSPFEAPALFSMMPYSELAHGIWFPRGGMYRIVEALMDIALAAGVEFEFDSPVQRILADDDSVEAILLEDGRRVPAAAVVANADLPYVYQHLLPDDGRAQRLARKRYSCSVISFFWGVDRPVEALGPHTLFLADDYRGDFDSIDRRHGLADKPSLYVHAPAHIDPSLAPPGQDTLTAIVPVGHLDENAGQDWPALRHRARRAVLRRLADLGVTDLEAHLKFEANYTPLSWRKRYNLVKGATHGLSHTLTQMAYFRPANRHPRLHNVYFVGASTHPGTGVPTALISGRLTAERLAREVQSPSPHPLFRLFRSGEGTKG